MKREEKNLAIGPNNIYIYIYPTNKADSFSQQPFVIKTTILIIIYQIT